MIPRSLVAALLLATVTAAPAQAATCALDSAPGATLLLPYFEVDAAHSSGRTTLFSINNAGPAATLAHVVLWTDAAVPTLAFDVYLTGYDVQTINLRDVFNGALPPTADAGRDPADVVSPKGAFSQDATFASCAGILPLAPLPGSIQDGLRRAHTGLGSVSQPLRCSGLAFGDGVARGYVTVDAARRCSILVPGDPGYFGPDGVASDSNTLWGDFFYLTPGSQQAAQGQNLVRLESDPQGFAGKPTFYSRYAVGGVDGREPLPTTWAVRFLAGGSFGGTSDLISWRDLLRAGIPFDCSLKPSWYPLGQRQIVIFDEEEQPFLPSDPCNFQSPPSSCPTSFPLAAAANRTRIGGQDFPVPFDFGWLFLDLNSGPTAIPAIEPAWVGTIVSANGLFSVGLAGTPLDAPCAPNGSGAIDLH